MKKIVIFITRDKFTDGLISSLEQFFGNEYEFDFYTNRNDSYKLGEHNRVVNEVHDLNEFVSIVDEMSSYDAVLISGLFGFIDKKTVEICHRIADKLFINFWGGDYICLQMDSIARACIKNLMHAYSMIKRRNRAVNIIRDSSGWLAEMTGEENLISHITGVKKWSIDTPIVALNEMLVHSAPPTLADNITKPLTIQVGNSADPTNRHLDVFDLLRKYKNENIKIICPLSYGDDRYADIVEEHGRKIFADKMIVLRDFLPKDEYYSLMNDIDIAIFNHHNQGAMGNIEEMLRRGKKVFIRKDTVMWNCYSGVRKQKIFDVCDILGMTFENFSYFSEEYANRNYQIDVDMKKNRWAENQWKKALSYMTNNDR